MTFILLLLLADFESSLIFSSEFKIYLLKESGTSNAQRDQLLFNF